MSTEVIPFELPEKVKIGPYPYILKRTTVTDGRGAWGSTSHTAREIAFGMLCNKVELPSTFLHELLHTIDQCYNTDLEEAQVIRLANGLTDVLQELGLYPEHMVLHDEQEERE